MDTEPRLNLDEIQRLIYIDRFIGPIEPIKDARLAAALLFHRYKDRTIRTLFADDKQPYILVTTWRDFSPSSISRQILVSEEVFEQLKTERVIQKDANSWQQWRLSGMGARLVIKQWVYSNSITDILKAGAIIDLGAGEISWTH